MADLDALLADRGVGRMLNACVGGMTNDTSVPAISGKTTFKGRWIKSLPALPPLDISFCYDNVYTSSSTGGDTQGAAFTITKAYANLVDLIGNRLAGTKGAIVYFRGQRAITVAAGAIGVLHDPLMPIDFGIGMFPPGGNVEYRSISDGVIGAVRPCSGQTFRPGSSHSWRALTANVVDDVDGFGIMAIPSGGDAINVTAPTCFLGRFATYLPSLLMLGDSLFARQNDTGGLSNAEVQGGGYHKRAAAAAGLPYFNIGTGGRTLQHQLASAYSTSAAFLARFTDAHIQFGSNDIAYGVALTLYNTRCQTLIGLLRAGGIRNVIQSTLPPRINDNIWKCTDLSQMVAFGTQALSVNGFPALRAAAAVTLTLATNGLVNYTAHGLVPGQSVAFQTTGALPTGLAANTVYFVNQVISADSFTITTTMGASASTATANGGSNIAFTGSQSGTHMMTVEGYGFGAGETRDQLNTQLRTQTPGGVNADFIFDLATYCQNATTTWKWKVSAYSSTLAGALTAGATTVTISTATPAVVTHTSHGLSVGQPVSFGTSGVLPAGLSWSKVYFIASTPTASTYTVSEAQGGAEVAVTAAGSGTHTVSMAGALTNAAAPVETNLVFEPGTTGFDMGGQGGPNVRLSLGSSAPFTAVTGYGDVFSQSVTGTTPGKAHSANSNVKGTVGSDGTHPTCEAYAPAAQDMKLLYRRLTRRAA